MSRVIVKGLPKNITEDKLRNLFSQKGNITDIQLKYTKEGVFRQFAFIGFQNEDEANESIKYFNNSCIQTSRIKVEACASLGGEGKPQAWSKYSKESSAFKKMHGISNEDDYEQEKIEREAERKLKKKSKFDEIIGEHKDDPDFVEFVKVHDKNRTLWSNDANVLEEADKNIDDLDDSKINETRSNEDDEEDEEDEEKYTDSANKPDEKLAEKKISDLEYMQSLIKKSNESTATSNTNEKSKSKSIDLYTIKMHNIPYTLRRQEIINFFKPLKPQSVRLPTKVHGFCYVGFKTEKDFQKAMIKDKSFIKGKQVFFADFTEKNKITKCKIEGKVYEPEKTNPKWEKQLEGVKNEEDISESGRIFFRNLAYTVTEDDLQKIFEKYGPVSEINLPIDSLTRQIKGFGTVTFLMPEHAVKAFNELDGSSFHGRLFHLIPAKSRDNVELDENDPSLSFKDKKALKLKKSAQQSHNWNTLFLGANAVADNLAKKFDTSKEKILDSHSGGSSAAVRLALGETQIVMEMKQFLEDNEVCLEAFEGNSIKRSKTIILVKNLPADTTIADLKPLFWKFGVVGRLILPPSGVTALIEFMDPSEAKQAFKKLAYSKFKSLPLYLEWAPENTFKTPIDKESVKKDVDEESMKKTNDDNLKKQQKEENEKEKEKAEENNNNNGDNNENEEEDEVDDPPEPETTLFLRNLNFKTREDTVRKHFKHLGSVHIAQVAMRKDPENPGNVISLGYGFIQFKKKATAEKALKQMQFTQIEGNQVELKRSDRTLKIDPKTARKQANAKKQTGTKIIVRNIPFQAKTKEVMEIFRAFGELRSVRIPKKMAPGEDSHRGFGFVDFSTKSEAKKAFEALSRSTHLYGRRLVLDWASTTEDDVSELRKRTAQSFQTSSNGPKMSRKAVFEPTSMDINNDENE